MEEMLTLDEQLSQEYEDIQMEAIIARLASLDESES